jgi:hypothetical protein
MKNIWILTFALGFGFAVQAAPLDDEIQKFADTYKSTSKSSGGDMQMDRMTAVAAQLESTLQAPGGETNLAALVKQLMATNPDASVQNIGKELLADLDARKKARADAAAAQLKDVTTRATDILLKAQKAQELDGLLADLQKLQTSSGGGYDPDVQAQTARVNAVYQFISQWQDYLSAKDNGNSQEAQNALRNLSNSGRQGESVLVPRSEILSRLNDLTNAAKSAAPNAVASGAPQAIDEDPILDGIKTLDDMEPALKTLMAKGYPNNQTGTTQALGQLVNLYALSKNGLPTTLDFSPNYNIQNQAPGIERLRAMLLIYLLPSFIGSGAPTPNPNEYVTDYLNRAIDSAETRQDWKSLQRIIEAETKIARVQNFPEGTRSFLSGLNQEIAGQYALAISSYQNSLKYPDDYVPAKVVGDRLAAIKKDHPTEYEEGMKKFSNPPAPAYLNPYMIRPGMGYPQSMPGAAGLPGMGNPAPTPPALPSTLPAPTRPPAPATNATSPAPTSPAR